MAETRSDREYVWQHFLPCVYLQQFSADERKAGRKSQIWRTDDAISVSVTVESQCAQDYYYSAKNRKEIEMFFGESEGLYADIARKIWDRQNANTTDYYGLITVMFDLFLRNAAHENKTSFNNFHAYALRQSGFVEQVLLRTTNGPTPTPAIVRSHLKRNWKVYLLEAAEGEVLITSDNPSMWFSWDSNGPLDYVLLPVTPRFCAIAYDQRFTDIKTTKLSVEDGHRINWHQIQHCSQCIYSRSEIDSQERKQITEAWTDRSPAGGIIDSTKWNFDMGYLPTERGYSFLTRLG